MARCKIPVSFNYTTNPAGSTPTYVSTSSGSYVSQAADLTQPVQNTVVTVTARSSGSPVTVYQTETSGATYTTLTTDASGNVPGWVNEGSYNVTAAAKGAFAGATYPFDAVRGDGVSNVASGAVGTPQLTTSVQNTLNQVATNTTAIATNAAKEIADSPTTWKRPYGGLYVSQQNASGVLWLGISSSGSGPGPGGQGGVTQVYDGTMGWSLQVPLNGLYMVTATVRADNVGGVLAYAELFGAVNGTYSNVYGTAIQTVSGSAPYATCAFTTYTNMSANDKFGLLGASGATLTWATASYGVFTIEYVSP